MHFLVHSKHRAVLVSHYYEVPLSVSFVEPTSPTAATDTRTVATPCGDDSQTVRRGAAGYFTTFFFLQFMRIILLNGY
jgi:hypothetical protein